MSNGETPGIGGVPGLAAPKTRMTAAYGRITKSYGKTAPANLGKARLAREQINRSFRVPNRKVTHG